MPRTHQREFRVRQYECDAYGHLNNANYVRFMQESAFDASAAAGFSNREYKEMERTWLIRATEIAYLQPVFYGDTIAVTTWVEDFRRATSRRAYLLERTSDGAAVARGFTDWVFWDTTNERPSQIPYQVQHAFFPEGLPESFPPREPFPKPPASPEGVYHYEFNVEWRDIDTAGHVNNAAYLDYVEEAGFAVVSAHGWSFDRMTGSGFAIFVRRHQVQYLQPAFYGDLLRIQTWASDVRRSTAVRHYSFSRPSDGALLARVSSLGVWVDLETGRPIRIPTSFIADFATNLS